MCKSLFAIRRILPKVPCLAANEFLHVLQASAGHQTLAMEDPETRKNQQMESPHPLSRVYCTNPNTKRKELFNASGTSVSIQMKAFKIKKKHIMSGQDGLVIIQKSYPGFSSDQKKPQQLWPDGQKLIQRQALYIGLAIFTTPIYMTCQ